MGFTRHRTFNGERCSTNWACLMARSLRNLTRKSVEKKEKRREKDAVGFDLDHGGGIHFCL